MGESKIQWCDKVWNPARGCSRVSEGCRNCYAERQAARFAGDHGYFAGFVANHSADHDAGGFAKWRWTGKVELVPEKLAEPLSWRKPQRVFVNSMSDLFHEALPFEHTLAIFGAMAACPHLTFQVLTKRPAHMRDVLHEMRAQLDRSCRFAHPALAEHAAVIAMKLGSPESTVSERLFKAANRCAGRGAWPLPNVWLGVSVEDQASADERIPLLLDTPAAIRFASAEPLLGPVDLRRVPFFPGPLNAHDGSALFVGDIGGFEYAWSRRQMLHWVIVGGESGPRARSCNVAWIRSIVEQCKASRVACFVKQLGARAGFFERSGPLVTIRGGAQVEAPSPFERLPGWHCLPFRDRKGGDIAEWPEDLRIREFPTAVRA